MSSSGAWNTSEGPAGTFFVEESTPKHVFQMKNHPPDPPKVPVPRMAWRAYTAQPVTNCFPGATQPGEESSCWIPNQAFGFH